MKKAAASILVLIFLLSLFSCSKEPSAAEMLNDFLYTYGIEGIIYSPDVAEGKDGYITEELFKRIYVLEGEVPENSAIFLNPRTDEYIECAIFVTESEDERARVSDMCAERIMLIDPTGEHSFILRTKNVVFYSALPDKERARSVIDEILNAYY